MKNLLILGCLSLLICNINADLSTNVDDTTTTGSSAVADVNIPDVDVTEETLEETDGVSGIEETETETAVEETAPKTETKY